MKAIEEKATRVLEQCSAIVVTSINEEGYPRSCVVSKLETDGFSEIIFSTGTHSLKTKHFKNNTKASVCFFRDMNSVTLVGNVDEIDDLDMKRKMWRDWMANHFEKGPEDPNYCLIKFTAKEATFWIDEEFVNLSY